MLILASQQPKDAGVLYINSLNLNHSQIYFRNTEAAQNTRKKQEGSGSRGLHYLINTQSNVAEASGITVLLYTSPYEEIFFTTYWELSLWILSYRAHFVSFSVKKHEQTVRESRGLQPEMLRDAFQSFHFHPTFQTGAAARAFAHSICLFVCSLTCVHLLQPVPFRFSINLPKLTRGSDLLLRDSRTKCL